MEAENDRMSGGQPKKRSFKSILKILDNNYTHSLSKAAIHLQFKEIVNIQSYDKESWDQWEEGLMMIGHAVGMNEHAQERLRMKELQKAKMGRGKRPNYHGKYGFAQVIQSREDAEQIIDSLNGDKNDLVTMLVVHTEAMRALKVANMRMHLALGIEEHKALIAREFAEECEVKRRELTQENKKLRKLLAAHYGLEIRMMDEELNEFLGEMISSSDDSFLESDDDGFGDEERVLGAEHCPLFNSDTRVAATRLAQQQMRAVMSKMSPQIGQNTGMSSIPPSKGPRLVARLSTMFLGSNNKEGKPSSGDVLGERHRMVGEAIEVSRNGHPLATLSLDSPPRAHDQHQHKDEEIVLTDAPTILTTPSQKDSPVAKGGVSPERALLLSPHVSPFSKGSPDHTQKKTITLDDGPLSPLRLLEVREAIRVDEKARLDLDEEEDEIKSAQLKQQPVRSSITSGPRPHPSIIESEENAPLFGWICKFSSLFSPSRQQRKT